MADYILSCCSTADLTKEQFAARDIHYVCFHFQLNGVDYMDDLGESISFEDFYKAMAEGADTNTSQVNVDEYEAHFEPFLKDGKDILHLTLSSGISGTLNSARIAAENMRAKYPERKVIIIDSLAAASGYGLLMDKLADLRDEGMSIDELAAWAEEHKLEMNHWFFTGDLTYLIRGGRVSKAAGFFGKMLNICPLLNVDYQGKLISREKIRTKRKAIKRASEVMKELARDRENYSDKVYIGHSMDLEDAEALSALIEEAFPKMKGKPEIYSIGTTIGSHTGPGLVVLCFWGDKRVD